MCMKKAFEMPEIEVVKFETEEVMNDFASWNEGENDMGWRP